MFTLETEFKYKNVQFLIGIGEVYRLNARILLANLYQSSRSTFLAQIFHAFLPSKKAYEMYQFRHWGVRQQYPLVFETPLSAYQTRQYVWHTKLRQCYRKTGSTCSRPCGFFL